jgi:hypothetical protein
MPDSKSDKYFEPNEPPEEIKQSMQKKKTLIVRFETKEDVLEFVKKTGIHLIHGKPNRITFPQGNVFDDI